MSASNSQGLPKSGVVSGSERREEEGRQGAGPPRAGNSECPYFSAEQLKTLPGIGDADAKNIIKGRPHQGEYELVQRKIIPWVIDEQIKSKIVAKQKWVWRDDQDEQQRAKRTSHLSRVAPRVLVNAIVIAPKVPSRSTVYSPPTDYSPAYSGSHGCKAVGLDKPVPLRECA
jgi:hypothetical protein